MGGLEGGDERDRERDGERMCVREREGGHGGWSKEREVPLMLVLALMPVQRDCMGGVTGR